MSAVTAPLMIKKVYMKKSVYVTIVLWIVLALINIVSLFLGRSIFLIVANSLFGLMNVVTAIALVGLMVSGKVEIEGGDKDEL